MKKILYMALCASCMLSCSEDIWIEDLTEMEEDKIRGRYELVSAAWEGDPIDLNDDGVATNDYLEEFGGDGSEYEATFQGNVTIGVPYTWVHGHGEWRNVKKSTEYLRARYDVLIQDNKAVMKFDYLAGMYDFTLIQNGLVSFRREMTIHKGSGEDITESTAPVLFTYKRFKYWR